MTAVKKSTVKFQSPLVVGGKVLIRTVTHFYTGEIAILTDAEIVLTKAAWISDTGRFNTCLIRGEFNEVEPYPDDQPVSINRGAYVDASLWPHDLPRGQK